MQHHWLQSRYNMENVNPPSPSNQYVINNVQQLFALNTNLVNFQSKFVVQSLSKEPFMGLVVNQDVLDSGQALDFRLADQGVFSGEILQDNNIPGNWYLILKSTKPNKVVVDIQTVPVAPRPAEAQLARQGARDAPGASPAERGLWAKLFSMSNVIKAVIIAVIVAGATYFGKRYLKRKQALEALPYASLAPPVVATHTVAPPNPIPVAVPAANPNPAPAPAPQPNPVVPEGITTEAILGKDLIESVNNLPAL